MSWNEDEVPDGTLGPEERKIALFGLIAALVVYVIPFTRFVLSALVTLCHEFGHAAVAWLLGHPSLPAFDFVYGGGFTHMGEFHPSIAVVIACAFGYLLWRLRTNGRGLALVGALFVVWLVAVTGEWRREMVIAAAGHAGELVLATVFLYQALSGSGWRSPEVERPLGAFVSFFLQIHSFAFARRLVHDPDFLAWYREGKGGALMNDLEAVALDLHIHGGPSLGIEGVARLLMLMSFAPTVVALILFLRRGATHRFVRSAFEVE